MATNSPSRNLAKQPLEPHPNKSPSPSSSRESDDSQNPEHYRLFGSEHGEYQGKRVLDVPNDYLASIIEKDDYKNETELDLALQEWRFGAYSKFYFGQMNTPGYRDDEDWKPPSIELTPERFRDKEGQPIYVKDETTADSLGEMKLREIFCMTMSQLSDLWLEEDRRPRYLLYHAWDFLKLRSDEDTANWALENWNEKCEEHRVKNVTDQGVQ